MAADPYDTKQIAALLGVDSFSITEPNNWSKKITVRVGTEMVTTTINTQEFHDVKDPTAHIGRIAMELAEVAKRRAAVKSAQSYVMNGIMSAQEVRAQEFTQMEPMEPMSASEMERIKASMTPGKPPLNRFEAVAEELKKMGDAK